MFKILNFGLLKAAFPALFLIIIYSCHPKDTVTPTSELSSKSVTIEEAKVLYEKYVNLNRTARTSKRKRKERPVWESGKNLTLSDGKEGMVVVIEEDQDALTLVSFDKDTNSVKSFEELFTSVKLLVYKDEKGKEHVERMYIKGDLDYAKRKKFRYEDSDFSGKIWFEDFEDNFLRGFFYKDGKTIGIQTVNDPNKKNARVAYTCSWTTETVTTTTNFYSISCYMNGSNVTCGQPQFMYSSTSSTSSVVWASCWDDGTSSSGHPSGTSLNIDDPGFWDWFDYDINGLEVNWLLTNPGKAYQCYLNFKQAEASSRQRYGGAKEEDKDQDGTNQNAYKHALAAAKHAKSWGKAVAYQIMNNHEGGPPPVTGTANLPLNSQMDYHNNKLGIDYQDLTNDEGDVLREGIQRLIDTGKGKRYVFGALQFSSTLINTTSANIDND
ncbi:hypothetical protein SAMN04487995_3828 [Dyadobacter koreensis]|uniref:DUF6973 domain-containing protein n=1 Tax=Dyadobacter koreensis TaxID=408657 RepID=A0A1H6XMY8_9BACT|nr:hypothetical protein [Dyadobacter koreensis]SEJ26200.1 hypothetical protein SAMN04487995_3828 [Dyadobacter koreensis]